MPTLTERDRCDLFAGLAMAALIIRQGVGGPSDVKTMARFAWEIARVMEVERFGTKEDDGE